HLAAKDKYGRQREVRKHSNLHRLYNLQEDEEAEKEKGSSGLGPSEEDDSDTGSAASDDADGSNAPHAGADDDNDEEDEEDKEMAAIRARSRLIRGEGVSDEYDESETDESDGPDDAAGEAEDESEEEVFGDYTNRFAVVNLDWDYVKAKDLFKAFSGFAPNGGVIKSVTIYPSEYGKERLAHEAMHGPPKEIFRQESEESKPLLQESEDVEFDEENLRKYQLDRMRYYYAVVACDSVATAKAIYDLCDGVEFEKTSNTFNLKFIPNGMDFDEEPHDTATELPAKYDVLKFATKAIQHSKVELTWDQDDPDRTRLTRRSFSKNQLRDMDFQAYVASSGSESESDQGETANLDKYRSLLGGLRGDASSDPFGKDKDVDMEITFTPGLTEAATAEKLGQIKERKDETVFEQRMRKQREKKKD
ncbi:pre-rRNA-processing protein esf1, partial [Cladochytrium tenue]